MAAIKRVQTGVPGLDQLIEGGVPDGYTVLVSGPAGSGKTILGLQFLVTGAAKFGEKGVYVTFQGNDKTIFSQGDRFNWKIADLVKKGMLKIVSLDLAKTHLVKAREGIVEAVNSFGAKRLVVDSICDIEVYAESMVDLEMLEQMKTGSAGAPVIVQSGSGSMRKAIMGVMAELRGVDATCVVISELSQDSKWASRDTVSEFASDGIIVLSTVTMGERQTRSLEVRKMRSTKIAGGMRPLAFGNNGLEVG